MLPLILKQATAILVAIGTLSAGMSAEPALAAQPEATHTVDTAADRNVDLPDRIVNGDFSYPNIIEYAEPTSLILGEYARWGYVIPSNGTVETDRQTGSKAAKIRDWDAAKFGWRSDSPSGGVSAFSAGTVEIQQDVKQDVGEQFAEIVAEQDKYAIYQDIATVPGTYLVWTLKHAPRGYQGASDSDSMQVLIGSTSKQTPQEAERTTSNGTGKVGEKSTTITTHATNDRKFHPWETYTGIYKVPEGQTVTRFTFRALTNSGMSGRTGNLIDDVTFQPMYTLTYDKNGGDGQVPSNKTPNTVTRAVRREDGATIVRNIAKTGAVQGCQVLYPAGTKITLATLEKDSDCWDSSMLKKTGHHQLGWNTNKNADSAQKTVTMTEGGLAVYAVWQPDTFTVDYNANGGKGTMDAQTATYGVPVTLNRNTFTRDGYTFAGWKTQADGGTGYADGAQITPNANITLYAQWTANKYTVAFDANGGTGTMNEQTFTYDQAQKLTANKFTRNGYTFTGWKTQPNGGTSYADQQQVKNLTTQSGGKITLYAQWTPNGASLRYDKNGGTGTMNVTDGKTDQNVTVSQNKFTRDGYTFTGWNTSADGSGTPYQPGGQFRLSAGGDVLYAQWKADEARLRYDKNNTKAAGTTEDTVGVTDQKVTVSENGYTYTGYTFTGWNTQKDGKGDTIQPGSQYTLPAGTSTLYAQWQADGARISYDGNGATGGTTKDTVGNTDQTVKTAKNGFERTGYTFTGWNTMPDGDGDSYKENADYKLPAGGSVLYAQWKANAYKVKYDANTGEGTMGDQSFIYDVEQALSANKFTKPGYTFKGWNTSKTGDGTGYEDRQTVVNLTADNGGRVVLYAQWEANPSRIQYDKNSDKATGETADTVGVTDQTVAVSRNGYQREGYTFAGWNTKADGTGDAYQPDGQLKLPVDHITLYAQWTANPALLTFDANADDAEGSTPDINTYYDKTVKLQANGYRRHGYTFTGWNTQPEGSGTAYQPEAKYKVTFNQTFYAQWQGNPVTVDYNPNGGDGNMPRLTGTVGGICTFHANTYERAGYMFLGWNTKPEGDGTGYADGQTLTCPADPLLLYAQWTPSESNISYNANGGTGTTPTTTGVTDQIVTVSQNGFTRDGYTFLGWNSKPDGTGYDYQPGGDYQLRPTPTILYAQWQAQPATLDYAANAQDATGSTPQTVSQQGEPVTVNDNGYQRPGYTFTGWNTQPDGTGDTLQPGTQTTLHPGTNTTVYAQWTPLPSTIVYDANHPQATGSTEPTTGVTGQQVEVNDNGYVLDGYTFTGWNTKTDGTGDTIQPGDTMTAPVEGVTLYAQWQANPATLTFDGNGGEGETPDIEGVTGQAIGMPANGFTLDGYTFTGWNTAKDGTGVGYQPDDQYTLPAGTGVMYAQWTPDPASVRFDPNGGTGSMDDMHGVTDEQSKLAKNTFENGCAKFAGWNTKPDGSGLSYEDEADWLMRGDIILYAQWEGDPECPTPIQPDEPAEEDKPLALTGVGLLGAAGALLVSLFIAAAAWLASRRQSHGRHR